MFSLVQAKANGSLFTIVMALMLISGYGIIIYSGIKKK